METPNLKPDVDFQEQKPRRGIYLLPNLLTTSSLFAAFYSIVASTQGAFNVAAVSIFIAMIADGLDGRLARLTRTQTAFGAQYDSLSDMVAFGLAPALLMYSFALKHLGKIGWLAAFLYTAAAALRLARFNVQIGIVDKRYFIGLSSTLAAGFIASLVWLAHQFHLGVTPLLSSIAAFLTASAAILMVSSIRYHSFKQIDFHGKVPFVAILLVVVVFVLVTIDPPKVLFVFFTAYALSGPVQYLINRTRGKAEPEITHPDDDTSD